MKGVHLSDRIAEENDDVIRSSPSSDVQRLAAFISDSFYSRDHVQVRAVGAGAVNQAVKALAIARGHVAVRGFDLVTRIGFIDIPNDMKKFNDSPTVTAVVFRLYCE